MRTKPTARAASVKLAARIAIAAWAGFSAMNAQAADLEDVAAAFGNTVLATYPDGRHQRIWMNPDGTYEGVGRRGTPSSGKWSIKDDKVCLKQAKPFPAPINYCTRFPDKGDVGVTWIGKDIAGTPITLKLVKGIEKPKAGAGS
jgi:hypothetical protein